MAYNNETLAKLNALEALATRINSELDKKATKANTLSGYGITDAYTKSELDGKISSVYKPGGSVAFADLPSADAAHLGMVYNVTDAFTTTETFLEGAGKGYPAGTNVVVVLTSAVDSETPTYSYDVLAGFVNLSGYVEKETGKGLSANDYTDAEKTKLNGIAEGATKVEASETVGNIKINGVETTLFNVATDAEVTEMLNGVFGAGE